MIVKVVVKLLVHYNLQLIAKRLLIRYFWIMFLITDGLRRKNLYLHTQLGLIAIIMKVVLVQIMNRM
jgi:hypothetical protein